MVNRSFPDSDDANGLEIVNVQDPAAPLFASRYATNDSARAVVIRSPYAYVASVAALEIVDIADPVHPQYFGGSGTLGRGMGVSVVDHYA